MEKLISGGKRLSLSNVVSHIILILSSITFIFPFYWMIITSLKAPDEIFSSPPIFIPKKLMWENYVYVTEMIPIVRMLFNSFFVSFSVTFGVLLFCSLSAYSFARIHFAGRDLIFKILLATMMVPGMVTIIPLFVLMKNLGWLDSYYVLIIPGFFGNAFGVFLLRQFFMTIPTQLDEAARMDGCSLFGIYYRILMPMMKPAMAALFIFTFMAVWNDFFWPLIMIQSNEYKTLSLGLATFQGMYVTKYDRLMVGAVISVAPVIIAYIFSQRYFIEGIALTGLKG
ncbi:MAG TPA: carbohydrate ABC transporter permease [Bacilli bacterium]